MATNTSMRDVVGALLEDQSTSPPASLWIYYHYCPSALPNHSPHDRHQSVAWERERVDTPFASAHSAVAAGAVVAISGFPNYFQMHFHTMSCSSSS